MRMFLADEAEFHPAVTKLPVVLLGLLLMFVCPNVL